MTIKNNILDILNSHVLFAQKQMRRTELVEVKTHGVYHMAIKKTIKSTYEIAMCFAHKHK